MLRALLRLHGLITDIGYLLAALGIGAMALLYCMEVVFRYALNAPTRWSLEVITYLMLAVTFLAIPHAVRAGMHIAVTLLADFYPGQVRRLAFVLNFVGFVLCLFLSYVSFGENLGQYTGFVETIGNLVFPKWWLSLFITYGFGNSALWYLRLLCTGGQPAEPELALVPRTGPEART